MAKNYHYLILLLISTAMPFFVTEPENVNTSEEEDAEFICEAGGRPKPSVTWSSNGVPFQGENHVMMKWFLVWWSLKVQV